MAKPTHLARVPLKLLVGPETTFLENDHICRVTRVTDLEFDTLDTVTGDVVVRSLHDWQTPRFTNAISAVRGLLPISGVGSKEDIDTYMQR